MRHICLPLVVNLYKNPQAKQFIYLSYCILFHSYDDSSVYIPKRKKKNGQPCIAASIYKNTSKHKIYRLNTQASSAIYIYLRTLFVSPQLLKTNPNLQLSIVFFVKVLFLYSLLLPSISRCYTLESVLESVLLICKNIQQRQCLQKGGHSTLINQGNKQT